MELEGPAARGEMATPGLYVFLPAPGCGRWQWGLAMPSEPCRPCAWVGASLADCLNLGQPDECPGGQVMGGGTVQQCAMWPRSGCRAHRTSDPHGGLVGQEAGALHRSELICRDWRDATVEHSRWREV